MERSLVYTWLLLAVATVATLADTSEDYLPRSIRPNEDSMSEKPPAEGETPLSFASSLKPVEFQYLVSLDAPEKPEEEQRFRYDVDEAPAAEEVQQEQQPSRAEIEAVLRKYFGSKSKYLYDKDQVGIPGKASRFRRGTSSSRTGAGSSSSGSASASASSSSSSFSNDGPIFYDQGFAGFGINGAGFGDFGGLGGGPQGGSNFGGGSNQGYGEQDDGLHSRFGGSDSSGTKVQGVFSGASSSINSNGERTYVVRTGKF